MSGKNGDSRAESALLGFFAYHSAMVRAILAGEMEVRPARPESRGFQIEAGGRKFILVEKIAGSMDVRMRAEPEATLREAEESKRLMGLTKEAIMENSQLRQLLSPLETAVMTAVRDPGTNELVSTLTLKRVS